MMAASGVFVVLFLCSVISSSNAAANCLIIQATTCGGDPVCGPIQNSYLSACALAFVPDGTCSQACKDGYDTLLSNPIGAQYYRCDCGGDPTCRSYTDNLLENCYNGVAPSPSTVIHTTGQSPIDTATCAAAQISCSSNRACGSLLLVYFQACSSAFLGVNCSDTCRKSFHDLLRDPVGSQFYGCQCGNDTLCETSGMNLVRTCYNGSLPIAPTVVVPPTVFAPGTCESFHELCFEREYLTCGSLFTRVHGDCGSSLNVSQNITCSSGCEFGLKSLLSNIPRARDVLACNCTNSSSSMCQSVIGIQRLFSVCGVSAPTLPPSTLPPPTLPPGSCEDNNRKCVQQHGDQCGSSVQQTFATDCSYFFDQYGQTNLSYPCTTACRSKLQALAVDSSDGAILTCNCVDENSIVCRFVMTYRPIFSHCHVTAPTTSYPTTKGAVGGGGPGDKAGNVEASLLIVFTSLVFAHLLLIA